jgi:hypothetical protein
MVLLLFRNHHNNAPGRHVVGGARHRPLGAFISDVGGRHRRLDLLSLLQLWNVALVLVTRITGANLDDIVITGPPLPVSGSRFCVPGTLPR